ncbi:GntR family transcriptional regulator (plasmid) [Peteryoungia desertarenae]|uniref:GntR family transcriptional regulator n=1 Tax=Peteryoungia desertarenae TaxID=1813451 RepID=A0ABX6QTF4_9HYPH|nr:GntR family transcriptional regulator [Peteryoungia desertarenae]QLF71728.1 GntR family transcriptional regulator [Peteryoungia desertarenae]
MDELRDHAQSGQAPRLGDAAYGQLRDRLSRGVYRPGDKLTVRSVAEALGLSSTPARDALNRLVAEGALVHTGPKTVVIPVLTEEDLREITMIRLALEGLAAELAAERCRPEDVAKLRDIQLLINQALDRGAYSDALWHNKEFHFHLYGLCAMPRLVAMIEPLWLRVGPSFHGLYPAFAEQRYGVRNHDMAIEAMLDGDGRALRAAMEGDIRDGYRRLRLALTERQAGRP